MLMAVNAFTFISEYATSARPRCVCTECRPAPPSSSLQMRHCPRTTDIGLFSVSPPLSVWRSAVWPELPLKSSFLAKQLYVLLKGWREQWNEQSGLKLHSLEYKQTPLEFREIFRDCQISPRALSWRGRDVVLVLLLLLP